MRIPFEYSLFGNVRQPQYAGSWYVADAQQLNSQLNSFLSKASPAVDRQSANLVVANNYPVSQPILAIVVPHAGYIYSGQAAAHGYKVVQGQKVKRVFLLGPSHHISFRGAALPDATAFATPLGNLVVDQQTVADLKGYPLFSIAPEVHHVEHSLEMQLPFIRQVLGKVKIVPIIIGMLADKTEMHLLGEILKAYVRQDDLVVVSSDFTHWGPRYDYQPSKDRIQENILKLDQQAFKHLSELDLDGFVQFQKTTKDTICGLYPCAVLLALLPKGSQTTVLKYYTSQDCAYEDKDNSVSYLALAFSGKYWPQSAEHITSTDVTISLSEPEKGTLLRLARKVLESFVLEGKVLTLQETEIPVTNNLTDCLGTFVSLYSATVSSGEVAYSKEASCRERCKTYELRGCIGNVWPTKPLFQAVIDNTIAACSNDRRFKPVELEELSNLFIEINVLTPPRPVLSYKDLFLGRDGILITKQNRQAVFLPSVAVDFGWDLPETLKQLSIKAGLKEDDWKEGARFDAFQAIVLREP